LRNRAVQSKSGRWRSTEIVAVNLIMRGQSAKQKEDAGNDHVVVEEIDDTRAAQE
jgi:hypothetical protein